MPRRSGPERAHFGGELGLVTETSANGSPKYFWRCVHCNMHLGGKIFPNAKARIHLSGDSNLRNGMISQVCTRAPEDVQKKFRAIIKQKEELRQRKNAKRKRVAELVEARNFDSPDSQCKLTMSRRNLLSATEVDEAWGVAAFTMDIAPSKINSPFFRDAIQTTMRSPVQ